MEKARKAVRRTKFLSELFIAVRFGLIGMLSTSFHIAIVWILLSKTTLPVLIANTIAFLAAFWISFTGNYLWTFGTHSSARRAAFRFFIISTGAFAFNSAVLGTAIFHLSADPVFSAACSAALIPVITFTASRLWCFNQRGL